MKSNAGLGALKFKTTRWSVVRRAVGSNDIHRSQALATLCESYWYPLYAYFRWTGKGAHDAEDLTQGFFVRLLGKNKILESANPKRGKLRNYLLKCAEHFLKDDLDHASAKKRDASLLTSFDAMEAEQRYALEPVDHRSPDQLFDRRWALSVLDYSLEQLEDVFAAKSKPKSCKPETSMRQVFVALRPHLCKGLERVKAYEQIEAETGIPVGTLRSEVSRLRKLWRALLLEEIAGTLDDPSPENIQDEFAALQRCV